MADVVMNWAQHRPTGISGALRDVSARYSFGVQGSGSFLVCLPLREKLSKINFSSHRKRRGGASRASCCWLSCARAAKASHDA